MSATNRPGVSAAVRATYHDRATSIREFITAYVECALWSSTAHGVPEDTGDGTFGTSFESYGFTADDIAPVERIKIMRDCVQFYDANVRWLLRAGSPVQNGHDYWLTRNHHGAGFWDRGYSERVSAYLTAASHGANSRDLYVGDDGRIYGF